MTKEMIPNGTTIRIDMSWYTDFYGESDANLDRIRGANHGMVGKVSDSWIDVDGERLYEVTLDTGEEVFAYTEKDLRVIPCSTATPKPLD